MHITRQMTVGLGVALALAGAPAGADGADRPAASSKVVLVELFTSQG